MKVKTFLAFLLLAIFSSPVFAQNEAQQILNRLYSPQGQMPVLDCVIELESNTASSDAPEQSGKMSLTSKDKIYFKNPFKIRIDALIVDPGGSLDGRQMIIIRDGTNAFQYLSTGQYPVKKQLDKPSPPLNLPFGLAKYPQDSAKKYTLEGRETVDGISAAKISIAGDEETTVVWIDTKRCVPLKLEVTKKDKKDSAKKSVTYKDIGQTKDGRYFPMKLEKYTNGTLSGFVIYKALTVNSDIDDGLFTPMEKFLR